MLKKIRNEVLGFLLRYQRLRKKTIVFEAYQGSSYACSPRALYEQMRADGRFDEYTFVWALRSPEQYSYLLSDSRTSLVKYRSLRYYMAYARAGYWIVNGWLPELLVKKPGQIMVQCWHGTPLKKLRNDIARDSEALVDYDEMKKKDEKDTLRYDYFISPSRFASEKFLSAFRLKQLKKEDIILETGYPRNDFLHTFTDDDVKSIKEKLAIPEDKKVVLYAPTWRDDQRSKDGFSYQVEVDFNLLRRQLSDEYVVLFRAHYNIASSFDFEKYAGFVINVSDIDDVNELYIVSDVLVTDYSSVMFDYANLGRPMLFFMYDLERYEKKLRGFYFSVDELPGHIIKDETDLIADLKDISSYGKKYAKKYTVFKNKFTYLDDGHASSRVIEKVFFDGGRHA